MPVLTLSGNEIFDYVRQLAVQGDGRAFPDYTCGIWEATTNYVKNGAFETDTSGWGQMIGTETLTRITSDKKFGTACMQVDLPAVAAAHGVYVSSNGGNPLTLDNVVVTVFVWVKGTAGKGYNLLISQQGGTQRGSNSNFTATGDWQWVACSATMSVGDTVANIIVRKDTSRATAETFFIGAGQIEQKTFATPYVHTNGATASRLAARPQMPSGLVDKTVGGIAIRFRAGIASTESASNRYLYTWRDDDNNRYSIGHSAGVESIFFSRGAAGVFDTAEKGLTWAVSDLITVVAAYNGTRVRVSVNGGTYADTSGAHVPNLTAAQFDIGSYDGAFGWFNNDVVYFAPLKDEPTQGDAAAIHTLFSVTKPATLEPWHLPGKCSALWDGRDGSFRAPALPVT